MSSICAKLERLARRRLAVGWSEENSSLKSEDAGESAIGVTFSLDMINSRGRGETARTRVKGALRMHL